MTTSRLRSLLALWERLASQVSGPRLHLALALTWLALLVPTTLWWRESVYWVAIMSLYANVVGHWSAYQGARAECEAKGEHAERTQT